MNYIFHIARQKEWEAARELGEYRISTLGQSLDEIGFIHCSFEDQVSVIGKSSYRNLPDLVLLQIDCSLLASELKVEKVNEHLYPHIYGPLNIDAVSKVSSIKFG